MEQGYHVASIRYGKGNKRGLAKLLVEILQAIDDYLKVADLAYALPEAPLFVSFHKGDYLQERSLHPNKVERIVKQNARAVRIGMSEHGMWACFITPGV